jgi:hypothetical protein
MGNGADCPKPTVTFDGRVRVPAAVTVTVVVALVTLGVFVLAVIVADPAATPVTGTVTLLVLAAIDTPLGTDTAAGFEEMRLMLTPPAGAIPDIFNVRF